LSLSDSVRLYSSVILIYLLTTRQVPGYPISYPVGYLGNELPDNDSPRDDSVAVQNIDNWAFDVFQINDVGEGHALKYIGLELLQKYDLINKYKVSFALVLFHISISAADKAS